MTSLPTWQVTGSYFEVCNCYAPCPCRRLGARAAGRSTYDTCDFALSWDIKEGHFGTDDLGDLRVAIAGPMEQRGAAESGLACDSPAVAFDPVC